MLEIIMIVGACVLMYKIADADDQSAGLWAAVTLLLCIATVILLPGWPFIRIGIAAVAAFIAMIVKKVITEK